MAAGLSVGQKRGITYRRLKKIQRELEAAGVRTTYKNWEVNHADVPDAFRVYVGWGNMSNGESVGSVYVHVKGEPKPYAFSGVPIERYAGNPQSGINRIKAEYGFAVVKL